MLAMKPEDGVRVTTPLYVGFGDISAAENCEHEYDPDRDGGFAAVVGIPKLKMRLETCTKCGIARRTRVEGPEELLVEHFPAEGEPLPP